MRVFYESDDGIIFYTKEECLAHEQRNNFSFIIGWKSEDGTELFNSYEGIPEVEGTVFRNVGEIHEALISCSIVYIPDQATLNVIKGIGLEFNIIVDGLKVGINYWVDDVGWNDGEYYYKMLNRLKESIDNFEEKARELVISTGNKKVGGIYRVKEEEFSF